MVLRLVTGILLLHSLQVANLRPDQGEVTVVGDDALPEEEDDSEGDGHDQDYV